MIFLDFFIFRFLLTIGCPMAFHNYPMDLQECNLKMQSCKYHIYTTIFFNYTKFVISQFTLVVSFKKWPRPRIYMYNYFKDDVR